MTWFRHACATNPRLEIERGQEPARIPKPRNHSKESRLGRARRINGLRNHLRSRLRHRLGSRYGDCWVRSQNPLDNHR